MTGARIIALLNRHQRRLLPLAALCLVLLLGWRTLQWLEPQTIAPQDQLIAQALPDERSSGQAGPDHAALQELRRTYASSPELEHTPIAADVDTMRVGLFVTNNYSIDMAVPMYASDGLLWTSWSPALQACFALYVWAANRINHAIPPGTAEQRAAIEAEINRVDRRFQLLCLLTLSLGSVLCWLL